MLFRIARKIIGSVILSVDKITSPKPLSRSAEQQAILDSKTSKLALYEMLACPFCVKVRREVKRLGLNIHRYDVKKNEIDMQALINGGGKFQVPCLRIEHDDKVDWLYESEDINNYLRSITE